MKIQRVYSNQEEIKVEDSLFKAIKSLRSIDECRSFFQDICTPAELQAIKDRWSVADYLNQGYTYREINTLTGVSLTTIGRVARFVSDGSGGYQTALKRTSK